MPEADRRRRQFLRVGALGAGLWLAAGTRTTLLAAEEGEAKVGAVEDLMREHGVLRRALLVYREVVPRLRREPRQVDPDALRRTALLFRSFGEDYHERKLEEEQIFPALRKAGGPAAAMPDLLVAQHNRGREITTYILRVAEKGSLAGGDAEPLARVLESFTLMYDNHATREDTDLFPAWKQTLSPHELAEAGEKFEEIEHRQFGKDGFEEARREIAEIEQRLGLSDLAQFTAPPPPAA